MFGLNSISGICRSYTSAVSIVHSVVNVCQQCIDLYDKDITHSTDGGECASILFRPQQAVIAIPIHMLRVPTVNLAP